MIPFINGSFNQSFNQSILGGCNITYINQSLDGRLALAVLLLGIVYVVMLIVLDFKVKEKYARIFFKSKVSKLQNDVPQDKQ